MQHKGLKSISMIKVNYCEQGKAERNSTNARLLKDSLVPRNQLTIFFSLKSGRKKAIYVWIKWDCFVW